MKRKQVLGETTVGMMSRKLSNLSPSSTHACGRQSKETSQSSIFELDAREISFMKGALEVRLDVPRNLQGDSFSHSRNDFDGPLFCCMEVSESDC